MFYLYKIVPQKVKGKEMFLTSVKKTLNPKGFMCIFFLQK